MGSRVSIVVFVAVLASTLQAQATWIVDASNGPGANFTDLPPAIAAAASGDTIIVRAGAYSAFQSIGKALKIRGAGASVTTVSSVLGSGIPGTEIVSVPSGQTFFVDGLKFTAVFAGLGFPPPSTFSTLRVLGPGATVLADVTILGAPFTTGGSVGLTASSGAELHLSRSTVNGGNATFGAGGGAMIVAGNLAVDSSTIASGTGGFGAIAFGWQGLQVSGAATISRTSIYGGSAPNGGGAGIYAAGGLVRIAGTSADVIQGAPALFPAMQPGIGIVAVASANVVVHGSVTILSPPGQPLTSGPVTLGLPALPYLSMTGTATPAGELLAAQPVTTTFDGVIPFAPFACGAELAPWFTTAFASLLEGELLLPVPTTIVLEGTLDAAGLAQVTLTPAVSAPALVNVPIYVQFAVFDSVSGKLRMSNGAVRIFKN